MGSSLNVLQPNRDKLRLERNSVEIQGGSCAFGTLIILPGLPKCRRTVSGVKESEVYPSEGISRRVLFRTLPKDLLCNTLH